VVVEDGFCFISRRRRRKERRDDGWDFLWVGGWMDWISQPVDYQTPSRTFRDPNEWNDSLETQSRGGS